MVLRTLTVMTVGPSGFGQLWQALDPSQQEALETKQIILIVRMFICFNFRLFDVAAIMFLWVKYLLWYQFKNHLIQFQPYVGNFCRGRWNNWKTRFVLSAFCPRTVRHGLTKGTPNDVIHLWRHSGLSKQTFHPFHNRKDVKDQGDFILISDASKIWCRG